MRTVDRTFEGGVPLDPWNRVWLESRALFDAYRVELPRRGQRLAERLYLYDRRPEGVSWCVWAWVGDRELLVGYPPYLNMGVREPLVPDVDALLRGCRLYLADLERGLGRGVGTTKALEPLGLNTPSCNYGARVTADGDFDVVWGVRGDWCGAGLVEWWSLAFTPFAENGPLPEDFRLVAHRIQRPDGSSPKGFSFALPTPQARRYLEW